MDMEFYVRVRETDSVIWDCEDPRLRLLYDIAVHKVSSMYYRYMYNLIDVKLGTDISYKESCKFFKTEQDLRDFCLLCSFACSQFNLKYKLLSPILDQIQGVNVITGFSLSPTSNLFNFINPVKCLPGQVPLFTFRMFLLDLERAVSYLIYMLTGNLVRLEVTKGTYIDTYSVLVASKTKKSFSDYTKTLQDMNILYVECIANLAVLDTYIIEAIEDVH